MTRFGNRIILALVALLLCGCGGGGGDSEILAMPDGAEPRFLDHQDRFLAIALSDDPGLIRLVGDVTATADELLDFSIGDSEDALLEYANAVMALAVAWKLTGNTPYYSKLIELINASSGFADLKWGRPGAVDIDLGLALMELSIAFSWVRDDLDNDVEARIVRLLNDAAVYADEKTRIRQYEYYWNHAHLVAVGAYAAGCVLDGDTRKAAGWRKNATAFLDGCEQQLEAANDACYAEGVAYATIVYYAIAIYRLLRENATGFVPDYSWWDKVPGYFAHTRRPDLSGSIRYGDDSGRYFQNPAPILRYVAAKNRDPQAQALAEEFEQRFSGLAAKYLLHSWMSVMFADPVLDRGEMDFGESWHFSDHGTFVGRSSWDADANLLVVRSGLPGGVSYNGYIGFDPTERMSNLGHIHADANSLSFWAGGVCLLADPGSEATKYSRQHNTLTFSGEGQVGDSHEWWGASWNSKPWGYGGRILSIEEGNPNATLVKMDASDAYWDAAAVSRFTRSVLWIKPNVLVVGDRVAVSEDKTVEANWITELGNWVIEDHSMQAGERLNIAVIGTQPANSVREDVFIRSTLTVDRLVNEFDLAAGVEQSIVHVIWDTGQPGWEFSSIDAGAISFTSGTGNLEITVHGNRFEVTGVGHFNVTL